MIATSSGFLRSSSAIFGNLRKMFGNVREIVRKRSSGLRNNFEKLRESSERGRKSSENRQKRRHQYVYIINRILHARWWIRILSSRAQLNISLVRYRVEHPKIKLGSTSGHLYTDSVDTGEMKTFGNKESQNPNQNPLCLRRHQKTETEPNAKKKHKTENWDISD